MAYSADSFVADEQPTTAKWNKLWNNDASFNDGTGLGDNTITSEKRKSTVAFRATRTADQSVNSSSVTKIQFNVEEYDRGSDYDAVTNFEFVAPYNGDYHFDGQTTCDAVGAGGVLIGYLYINGSQGPTFRNYASGSATDDLSVAVCSDLALSAGDTVDFRVQHAAGAARAQLGTSTGAVYFSGHLVGRT